MCATGGSPPSLARLTVRPRKGGPWPPAKTGGVAYSSRSSPRRVRCQPGVSTMPRWFPLQSESDLPGTPDVDAPRNDVSDVQWIPTDSPLSHNVQSRPFFASPSGVVRPKDVHLALAGPMSPVGPQKGDVFGADFIPMPRSRVAVRCVRATTSFHSPREPRPCTVRGLGAILLAAETIGLPFRLFERPYRLNRAAIWGSLRRLEVDTFPDSGFAVYAKLGAGRRHSGDRRRLWGAGRHHWGAE